MMPKGVEHLLAENKSLTEVVVKIPMMPKGVEHEPIPV